MTFDSLFAGSPAAERPAQVPVIEGEAIANEFTKLIIAQGPVDASDSATSTEQSPKAVVNLKQ